MAEQAPLVKSLTANTPAVVASADKSITLGEAPYAGTVTGITYAPDAAITGANTETRTLTVVNKGQAGAGTTVIGTLAYISGVNGVAFDERAFTLSAVSGATTVAESDILAFVSTHGGSTGLADPGGRVEVIIERS